jgi:hypothetical protein
MPVVSVATMREAFIRDASAKYGDHRVLLKTIAAAQTLVVGPAQTLLSCPGEWHDSNMHQPSSVTNRMVVKELSAGRAYRHPVIATHLTGSLAPHVIE